MGTDLVIEDPAETSTSGGPDARLARGVQKPAIPMAFPSGSQPPEGHALAA